MWVWWLYAVPIAAANQPLAPSSVVTSESVAPKITAVTEKPAELGARELGYSGFERPAAG